jgi:hypothetical protein
MYFSLNYKNRLDNTLLEQGRNFSYLNYNVQVMIAERSKAWTVFVRSEAEAVGLNITQGMDVWCVCVCVSIYSVFVLFCI